MYLKNFIIQQLTPGWQQIVGQQPEDLLLNTAQRVELGDYQINQCLALAPRLKKNAKDLAQQCVDYWQQQKLVFIKKMNVTGPGFINLSLADDWLFETVNHLDDINVGLSLSAHPQKIVVEYSSPNVAKAMHVGHLRTTIIGDSLARLYQSLGHHVIRQNHLGDWGTQFGLLLALWQEENDLSTQNWQLQDFEMLYRRAKIRADHDPVFAELARSQVVALQNGDPSARQRWKHLREQSINHIQQIYQQLNVLLTRDDIRSESDYDPLLPELVKMLLALGIAEKNQGAICVFVHQDITKQSEITPLIIQKKDGAYLYGTTDLAAIKYRLQTLQAERILYVVDSRQSMHFRQIFAIARHCGWVPEHVKLEHVSFGTMNGPDGKPFKTRSGEVMGLAQLLIAAEKKALTIMQEKQPLWSLEQQQKTAKQLALAAIKYADLSRHRATDYHFSLEHMLSFQGNTAPYILYGYTRIQSLLHKLSPVDLLKETTNLIDLHPSERALALLLLQYPDCLLLAAAQALPHLICQFLYHLAQCFAQFYEYCSIDQAPQLVKIRRYQLIIKTRSVLAHGLNILGIQPLDKM